jgi:hypothetical protein
MLRGVSFTLLSIVLVSGFVIWLRLLRAVLVDTKLTAQRLDRNLTETGYA